MQSLDLFLYTGFPYIALVVFLVGTIWRYRATSFKFSSLSSGFLEKRRLAWGSLPFHWGLMMLFFGHLMAFAIPGTVLAWNSEPVRLIILEASAFAFGLSVIWGLGVLFVRRMSSEFVRSVTRPMDIVIEVVLLAQTVLGLWTALAFRWGSSWFAASLTPYLRSIFILQPDASSVIAMPWTIKYHIVGAFLIIALIPFTRLVHVLVLPLHYLIRPYQRVIWNWRRESIRNPASGWTPTRPKNN
jgi:nitrate reductase gamma subunit